MEKLTCKLQCIAPAVVIAIKRNKPKNSKDDWKFCTAYTLET